MPGKVRQRRPDDGSLLRRRSETRVEAQKIRAMRAQDGACVFDQRVKFDSLLRARATVGGGGLTLQPRDDIGAGGGIQPRVRTSTRYRLIARRCHVSLAVSRR